MKIDHEKFVGVRFGALEVIKILWETRGRHIKYLCKCECGIEIEKQRQLLVKRGTVGCNKKCIFSKKYHKEIAPRSDIKKNGESSLNYYFWTYTRNAKKRNVSFEITKDEFYKITQEKCFYCGVVPHNKVKYHGKKNSVPLICNGVDRIDNEKGYFIENCRPCCSICNRAKGALKIEDFVNWIKNIKLNNIG